MVTKWLVRFTDGSDAIVETETIQEAIDEAEFYHDGKYVRSATFVGWINGQFEEAAGLVESSR